ncbi:MAG: 4Fe-4S binding protein [Desulfovibrionaceae bacterium]
MRIRSLKAVCFSPTGASRAVLGAVARGLGRSGAEPLDLTRPEARREALSLGRDDLLVIAVPVYVGRVPALAREWLRTLTLDHTPAVCVVVYGNRAFEDALLELCDLVRERGGAPVAGAAFIGEHSFSTPATPIAVARPDAADLALGEDFGRRALAVAEALSVDSPAVLAVPGNRPYRESAGALSEPFVAAGEGCVACGTCAAVCPTEAIDPAAGYATDMARCIHCCACIKACPEGARAMVSPAMRAVSERLSQACAARREPEFFLPGE